MARITICETIFIWNQRRRYCETANRSSNLNPNVAQNHSLVVRDRVLQRLIQYHTINIPSMNSSVLTNHRHMILSIISLSFHHILPWGPTSVIGFLLRNEVWTEGRRVDLSCNYQRMSSMEKGVVIDLPLWFARHLGTVLRRKRAPNFTAVFGGCSSSRCSRYSNIIYTYIT